MLPNKSLELYQKTYDILQSVIEGNEINPEFDAYVTDTAIAIRYSGVIPALLNNEKKEGSCGNGLKTTMVNWLLLKLLKEFYHYPPDYNYPQLHDFCSDNVKAGLIKSQILEILGSLKFALKTYKQADDFCIEASERLDSYQQLKNEHSLNVTGFNASNLPALSNSVNANLRLSYYAYLETQVGHKSWFDEFGLKDINDNIWKHLEQYMIKFDFSEMFRTGKIPKPHGCSFYQIKLMVDYRGILLGTGYPHMNITNDNEHSDYQLGFFFDHSTGIPIIPASSIKGFLRSAFPDENLDEYALDRFKQLLKAVEINDCDKFDKKAIKILVEDTFGTDTKPAKGNVFFNAFIQGMGKFPNDPQSDDYMRFIDEDCLAPHIHNGKRSKLREPNPIRFLKISPGVVFNFSFMLRDTEVALDSGVVVVTAIQKIILFKKILKTNNLGAKHNTGFGSLVNEPVSYKLPNSK